MVRTVLRWSVELGLKILDIDREEFVEVRNVLQDLVLQGLLSKNPFGLSHSCRQ
jgi:energy-coupling factor transporter ATP-binding protein EcfA2